VVRKILETKLFGWGGMRDENDSLIVKVIPLFPSFKEACNLLLESEKVIFNQKVLLFLQL